MFSQLDAPTPLDIQFRLGRYLVRISAWFWLGSFLLGFRYGDLFGPAGVILWVLCTLVTITLHELGHAVVGTAFGRPSRISLVAMGGYAEFYDGRPRAGWPCLWMILAGPATNFLLAFLVYVTNESVAWTEYGLWPTLVYAFLLSQNICWGILNLTPVWPLDGGQALREILHLFRVRRPDPPTHLTGVILGAVLALVGLATWLRIDSPLMAYLPIPYNVGPLMTVLFAAMTLQNWQMYKAHQVQRDPWEEDSERWRG